MVLIVYKIKCNNKYNYFKQEFFTCVFSYVRTPEDVKIMIKHAKLEEEDLKSLTQTIYFSNKSEEYRLLEMNSSVIGSLQEGER